MAHTVLTVEDIIQHHLHLAATAQHIPPTVLTEEAEMPPIVQITAGAILHPPLPQEPHPTVGPTHPE